VSELRAFFVVQLKPEGLKKFVAIACDLVKYCNSVWKLKGRDYNLVSLLRNSYSILMTLGENVAKKERVEEARKSLTDWVRFRLTWRERKLVLWVRKNSSWIEQDWRS
jgi:hypothetical protein